MGDIVAIPDEHSLDPLEASFQFKDRQDVCQGLAWMIGVTQTVDDRDGSMLCKLGDRFGVEGPDHDPVYIGG